CRGRAQLRVRRQDPPRLRHRRAAGSGERRASWRGADARPLPARRTRPGRGSTCHRSERGGPARRSGINRERDMAMQIRSKLPNVGTTIFTVMSQLAARHGAVNLGQGFPDFDGPPELYEALARHVREGRNQYAPMAGVPELREQIALKTEKLY